MTLIGNLFGIANREPWQAQALCAQVDPEIFFPDRGGSPRDAKRICGMCSVREQCLAYALTHGECWGVWGGTTSYERFRRNGGLETVGKPAGRRCFNGHKLDNPETDNTHNCRQCAKERYERYAARVRAGLVGGRRPKGGAA